MMHNLIELAIIKKLGPSSASLHSLVGHEGRINLGLDTLPSDYAVHQVIWDLIRKGIAFLIPEGHWTAWKLCLTDYGKLIATESEGDPHNQDQYLSNLSKAVPSVSKVALQHIQEAVLSFNSQCYMASSVMVGVASEAAFLEMAGSFARWIAKKQADNKLQQLLDDKRKNLVSKFDEVRKRLDSWHTDLPEELTDTIEVDLNGVLTLLRTDRNDAGHPTGKAISRDQARTSLLLLPRYLIKLYAFKGFFDGT